MPRMIFILIGVLALISVSEGCMSSRFPSSDHYDGSRFHNLDQNAGTDRGLLDLLKWKLGSSQKAWPDQKLMNNAVPQSSESLAGDDLRITFVNHATVLIQWNKINILTDPVFSEKLGPLAILNLKRYRDPGIPFSQLPKIDFIFISHNHYDHLDSPSLAEIEKRDRPHYIVPLGVSDDLPSALRERITELDWWQTYRDPSRELAFTLVPAQHWSKRSAFDTNQTLWGGVVVQAHRRRVFFAGDTGYASHFKMIAERLGQMDIALLPIGAYEPRWFMEPAHMNPADAVQAHLDLRARRSIAIHFGSFRLTDEAINDPIDDLKKATEAKALTAESFLAPKNGESFLIHD